MKRPPEGVGLTTYAPRYLPSEDATKFAWRGLRRFHNAEALVTRVMGERKIPERYEPDVKKQMLQLRYCLIQAREYFDAAEVASLSTRGVQLYYCCMSLALAQILWKGTGDVSLDRARQEHQHHGLGFAFPPKLAGDFRTDAASMLAKPNIQARGRLGTFELWHQSARQQPLLGITTRRLLSGGIQGGLETILATRDERMPEIPVQGISLLECVRYLPAMTLHLATFDEHSALVRAVLRREDLEKPDGSLDLTYKIIVQPGEPARVEAIREGIGFDANLTSDVDCYDFPIGFSVTWRCNSRAQFGATIPDGFCVSAVETYLAGHGRPLNEFGYLYAGLYICGMFSRYYPDLWQKEIERSSDLSICIEFFLETARDRLALLTLMELESVSFVPHVAP